MGRPRKYSPEVRKRAVRLVFDRRGDRRRLDRFTERLLTHLYTEPAKLRLAQERMTQRKAQRTEAKS